MSEFTRLTPENVDGLLTLMQDRARRGPVRVSQHNVIGGHPFYGNLTFRLNRAHGILILAALADGLLMNTPVAPDDFKLQRQGDAVAYYLVAGKKVTIRCEIFGFAD